MTQFQKSTRPLRPESIRAAARRFRQLCDMIERYSEASDPRDKQQLTRAIHGLSGAAQALSRRHRQQSLAEDLHAQHRADAYDASIAE